MDSSTNQSNDDLPFTKLQQASLPTLADRVFNKLHTNIRSLKLTPNTKLSETVVAEKMGVSRQPVREAFKRLSKLGFLNIRPQSSTTVSLISEEAVLRARYIRAALESHTCRSACEAIDEVGLGALASLIKQQRIAIEEQDKIKFHALDDQFHREICVHSGVGYVWDLIHENKTHMDRLRMLSLNPSSQQLALEEHIEIFNSISARDVDATANSISKHLRRILTLIDLIKSENHPWFEGTTK